MTVEGSRIDWDFPISLNFCAYVGEQEGFRPEENLDSLSPLEKDWNLWWGQLIATLDEHFRRWILPATPITESQVRELTRMAKAVFDPPHFRNLKNRPALRDKCRNYWRKFYDHWNETERQFHHNLFLLSYRLPSWDILAQGAVSSEQGLRRLLILRVTFVLWPRDFYLSLAPEHIIVGIQYLEQSQVETLADKIKLQFSRQ